MSPYTDSDSNTLAYTIAHNLLFNVESHDKLIEYAKRYNDYTNSTTRQVPPLLIIYRNNLPPQARQQLVDLSKKDFNRFEDIINQSFQKCSEICVSRKNLIVQQSQKWPPLWRIDLESNGECSIE